MGNSILSAAGPRPVRQRDPADCARSQQLADRGGDPLLLLFIFGYGINLDSSRLRVGVLRAAERRGAGFRPYHDRLTLYRRHRQRQPQAAD